jgi:hypothetical protein
MSDVFSSQSVKIEFPLTDGSAPVLEIAPQEPSFQLFALQCGQPILDPQRGYLGATIRAVTPDSGLSAAHGVVVNEIAQGAPAARFGLRLGDIVTVLDAKPNGQR